MAAIRQAVVDGDLAARSSQWLEQMYSHDGNEADDAE
jgi:hypothetical protein